jgi:hypothetical protein
VHARRHEWVYLFGAARLGGEATFALVPPTVNTDAMQIVLDRFAGTLTKDEHAVMVLDGAGWHTAKALRVRPKFRPGASWRRSFGGTRLRGNRRRG